MIPARQDVTMPRRSYSYSRISTGEQAKGDGLRRQDDFAAEISREEGWCLDDSLTYADRGRSGYHRHNLSPTADLTRFLTDVERGRVTPGSVLIVENLDRLSRAQIDEAYDLFRKILKAGVWIATKEPRRVYRREDSGNMLALLEPLFIFARGHEESQIKSTRAKAAWQVAKKRTAETKAPLPGRRPCWLRVINGEYQPIPEHVETIRRLIAGCAEGLGYCRLSQMMEAEGRPTVGDKRRWTPDNVKHLIVNRAVIGESVSKSGGSIPNVYPPVVSEDEWLRAQAAIGRRNRRRPGKAGEAEASLFTGFIFDADSRHPLTLRGMKGSYRGYKRYRYLSTGLTAGGTRVPYPAAEAAILETLAMLRPEDVLEPSAERTEKEHRIATLAARQTALGHRKEKLVAAAADPDEDLETNRAARRAVADELAAVAAELQALKLEAASGRTEALGETQSLLDLLGQAEGEERANLRRRIKSALPSVVTEIWVKPQRLSRKRQITHIQIFLRGGATRYVQLLPRNLGGAEPWDFSAADLRTS